MKKTILLLSIITLFSCQDDISIVGKWELASNSGTPKSQVEIYPLGEKLYAKRVQLSDINIESGWTEDDICWKEIKKLNDSTYSCIRIAKRLNEGLTEILEVESTINIRNNDLITVKAFYTDNKLDDEGRTQTYVRLQ